MKSKNRTENGSMLYLQKSMDQMLLRINNTCMSCACTLIIITAAKHPNPFFARGSATRQEQRRFAWCEANPHRARGAAQRSCPGAIKTAALLVMEAVAVQWLPYLGRGSAMCSDKAVAGGACTCPVASWCPMSRWPFALVDLAPGSRALFQRGL